MPDIFNRATTNLGGVFTADGAVLSFANGVLNTLAQQVQFQYSQAVSRLYEVGSSNIYYVGGQTQGQANLSRVIGPVATICAIYETYGNVCDAKRNTVTLGLNADCSNQSVFAADVLSSANRVNNRFTMSFCVITQVGISVAAQDMVIDESTTMMFGSLECTGE